MNIFYSTMLFAVVNIWAGCASLPDFLKPPSRIRELTLTIQSTYSDTVEDHDTGGKLKGPNVVQGTTPRNEIYIVHGVPNLVPKIKIGETVKFSVFPYANANAFKFLDWQQEYIAERSRKFHGWISFEPEKQYDLAGTIELIDEKGSQKSDTYSATRQGDDPYSFKLKLESGQVIAVSSHGYPTNTQTVADGVRNGERVKLKVEGKIEQDKVELIKWDEAFSSEKLAKRRSRQGGSADGRKQAKAEDRAQLKERLGEEYYNTVEGWEETLCNLKYNIAMDKAAIKKQRDIEAVSGVVDMAVLHSRGKSLIESEAQEKNFLLKYKTKTKKAFNWETCKEQWAALNFTP